MSVKACTTPTRKGDHHEPVAGFRMTDGALLSTCLPTESGMIYQPWRSSSSPSRNYADFGRLHLLRCSARIDMVFLPLFSLRMVRPGSVPGATVVVCLVPAPVARLTLRASLIIFLIIQQTKFKLILFIIILSISNIIKNTLSPDGTPLGDHYFKE